MGPISTRLIVEELKPRIIEVLECKLSKDTVRQKKHNRRGVQRDAHAAIAHAVWGYDESLLVQAEYGIDYFDGARTTTGAIDTVVFCEDHHHKGLILAIEIVTTAVESKDLYKLRDAPVVEGGGRWIVQLDPRIRHPLKQPQALDVSIGDEQMERVTFIQLWRNRQQYNGLERRKWARAARERQESKDSQITVWAN